MHIALVLLGSTVLGIGLGLGAAYLTFGHLGEHEFFLEAAIV